MSSELFMMIDRIVSYISPINAMIDYVLNWFLPKMVASAVTCQNLRWATTCQHGDLTVDPLCAGGVGVRWYTCTQWWYDNGKKYGSCNVWTYNCGFPSPGYPECESTCS